ncbi:MAG: RING finger domain-containing protein, partial [bacterium]
MCMLEFAQNEEVIVLPCNARHRFHEGCIVSWLQITSRKFCPLDRQLITME